VVEAGSVVGATLSGHIDAPRFRRIDLSKKSVHRDFLVSLRADVEVREKPSLYSPGFGVNNG